MVTNKTASQPVGKRRAPALPSRTVKPRRRTHGPLPVIAISADDFLAETGETGTIAELVDALPDYAPTLFCAVGAADFVAMLNSVYLFRTPGTWTWRAATQEKSISAPNEIYKATRITVPINYFGWNHGTAKRTKSQSHYHKIIDPVTMYGHSLDTIWPGDDDTIRKLLQWAITLRDFCAEHNMEVRPTLGSLAAQLLRDPRFYPNDRRKVPAQINQRARENLPGNHYFLNIFPDPSNNFSAHYLDQHNAHHYHVRTTPLPDSNHCYAYGRFMDLDHTAFQSTSADFHGLYCLDLLPPEHRPPFDWVGDRLDAAFVYSNELQHLLDVGYRVHCVRAAWGSIRRDIGLSKYAAWAEDQLAHNNGAAWLKPLLLATYGVLATRPMNRESIFRLAKKGTPVKVRTGRSELNGLHIQSPRKLEPGVAHVIQRGMIEAATRSESVAFAQYLDYLGHTVLSIYADAVIVEADDDKPLPVMFDPWRNKRTLNHLQFINRQAFSSDGMTKLPGITGELRQYHQHAPGHAPRRVQYEALTGKKVQTGRRI